MALAGRPIRSPRKLYKLEGITRPGPNNTTVPVLVKMKESIGDFLGLTPVAYNDPMFNGTFAGSGLNQGSAYRKRLGGFKTASYTLIAKTQFTLTEIRRTSDGSYEQAQGQWHTISIGFPRGHSGKEVVNFIMSKNIASQISAIRTPSGAAVDVGGAIT